MESHLIAYLLITGVIGVIILLWLQRYLNKLEDQRIARVERLHQFHPIETDSPVKHPQHDARISAADSLATRFSIIRRVILLSIVIIWIIALVFPFLGQIPTTVISLLAGALAVIVGIAARPFIENMISGIVISLSRQLRTGDTVLLDDRYGTVEDISLTHTVIKLWDWRRYIIPNSQMLTKDFVNYSITDSYIWEHIKFWVSYESDIKAVQEIALRITSESDYFADYEAPRFWTMDMQKEGIQCWVAGWTNSPSDAWMLKTDVRSKLIQEFQKHGIKSHMYRYRGVNEEQRESTD